MIQSKSDGAKTRFARVYDRVARLERGRATRVSDGSRPSDVYRVVDLAIDFFASPSKRVSF